MQKARTTSEKQFLIIERFYLGDSHDEIAKKTYTTIAAVSIVLTEHLKGCEFTEVTKLQQVKSIEDKLFYYLYKEDKTIADNKIIDELAPIYERFLCRIN